LSDVEAARSSLAVKPSSSVSSRTVSDPSEIVVRPAKALAKYSPIAR